MLAAGVVVLRQLETSLPLEPTFALFPFQISRYRFFPVIIDYLVWTGWLELIKLVDIQCNRIRPFIITCTFLFVFFCWCLLSKIPSDYQEMTKRRNTLGGCFTNETKIKSFVSLLYNTRTEENKNTGLLLPETAPKTKWRRQDTPSKQIQNRGEKNR